MCPSRLIVYFSVNRSGRTRAALQRCRSNPAPTWRHPKKRSKPHDRIRFIALSRAAHEPDKTPPPGEMRKAGVLDPESFKRACAQFATGVTIVTVRVADGTPHGLTVNSFTSISLSPPLILVCIGYGCTILPH